MTDESLAHRLIEHCNQPVDASLLQRARLHLLDWMGCVYGAAREEQAQILKTALLASVDHHTGDTPSFGLGRLNFDAAFTYSTALGNVLEMDDLARTAIVHAGPVVVPAALYTALQSNSNYADLLLALVRGYEAAIRLGNSLDAYHYQRWHPTSTAGVAGAAIACAAIRKLDSTQQLAALCNALSVSGGLWHTRHGNSMTKQWHSVHTARTGMSAVQSALYGFTAAEDIIEGEQGWHQVLAANPSAEEIVKAADWAILQTSFKPWPACRHCHAAIDAALKLARQLNGALQNVSDIAIDAYKDAQIFCDKVNPGTPAEARFSLQHSVAVALCNGTVQPADFETEALQSAKIVKLRKITTVNNCSRLTANYPAHFGATVTIKLNDGQIIRQEITDAMGDPEWPLDTEQIRGKFDMLCDWGVGDRSFNNTGVGGNNRTNELAEAVLHAPGDIKMSELLKSAL